MKYKYIITITILTLILLGCTNKQTNIINKKEFNNKIEENENVIEFIDEITELENSEIISEFKEPITEITMPIYTYTDLSKTMYAKTSVNVRDLPSTDGNKIGLLKTNDEVQITGQCNETEWYRIEYSGSIGYVSNKYLDDNEVEAIQITPNTESIINNSEEINTIQQYPIYYEKNDVILTINKEWYINSWCYIANIKGDISNLCSTISKDGLNTAEKCSSAYNRLNAYFLVNGDYYSTNYAQNMFLIRNSEILKDGISDGYGIGIYSDGQVKMLDANISATDALNDGVVQSLMFGPRLVDNSVVVADQIVAAPHTAIGITNNDEIYIIVNDGRMSDGQSVGLNLNQLGQLFLEKGCYFAYNLDGGGSSEMIFNGNILNSPSDGHERAVNDFLYLAN